MAVFGLVVEGDYDAFALKSFLRNNFQGQTNFTVRVCGGPIRKLWMGFLEEFRSLVEEGKPLDQAIVLMDSDHRDPEALLSDLKARKSSKLPFPFPILLGLAVKELEAWLLSDEQALSTILGTRVNAFPGNIEEYSDPKGDLEYLLITNGVFYTKEKAGEIASLASISTIRTRCSWFNRLVGDLTFSGGQTESS